MFEGRNPAPAGPAQRDSGDSPPRPLLPLNWSDLVARLAAAQDLRTFIGTAEQGAAREAGSFDLPSARWIAEHQDNPLLTGDSDINPEASANCKWAVGNNLPASRTCQTSRGME